MPTISGDQAAVLLAIAGCTWYLGCAIGRMDNTLYNDEHKNDSLKQWQYLVSLPLMAPIFLRLLVAAIFN